MVKPLTIHVAQEWAEHPEVAELQRKGHTVVILEGAYQPDLILHPAAHMWRDEMWPMLPVAVKAARKAKYGEDGAKPKDSGKRAKRGYKGKDDHEDGTRSVDSVEHAS